MKKVVPVLSLAIFIFLFGCSTEQAKRTAYEALRNKARMECLKNPSSPCPKDESYDEYQRARKELPLPAR